MTTPAVVLAAFGVANPEALAGITGIVERFRGAFSQSLLRLSFTSNQIRRIWRERGQDPAWRESHPETPPEVLEVQGPLATVANLQDAGCRDIVVQSLHVYAGEEYFDLMSYLKGLNSIKTAKPRWMPFRRLLLGRPALGAPGPEHPYLQDLERAAAALWQDAEEAQEKGAILVYAGHGNPFYSTGVYLELEMAMQAMYPGLRVAIGVVEGAMGLDYLRGRLAGRGKDLLLKPLMVVAGEHARQDICGGENSWRRAFEDDGHRVECRLQGLGEMPDWAQIYLDHTREAWERASQEAD